MGKSFTAQAERICFALGDTAVRLHHIGSTSIPHTKAKPVIDMLLEVNSLDAFVKEHERLALLWLNRGCDDHNL